MSASDAKRVSISLDGTYQARFEMLAIEYAGGNRSELARRMIDEYWKRLAKTRIEQMKATQAALEEQCSE